MKPLVVFLDANVLYSAGLRDLFMHLHLHDLCHIKWSNQVQQEWMRNLLARRPDLIPQRLERTRQLMIDFAPDSLVEGYESLSETLTLPDPDDRHVLAAAMTGNAKLIVTFNLSDFPQNALQPFGIKAWHPDTFITHLLDINPEQVCTAIRQHRIALRNPPKTIAEYLDERSKDGLTTAVLRLREYESLI